MLDPRGLELQELVHGMSRSYGLRCWTYHLRLARGWRKYHKYIFDSTVKLNNMSDPFYWKQSDSYIKGI
jgi:hypothetical protein